jgi:3-hydroxyisobutyrate dehydrogenase-like beta-hydroxyacid dehydrogenase
MSDRDSVTVAIVGAGEMGAAVGRRLREAGARVVTSLAGRGAESVARVRSADLEVVNDDDALALDASFVLSIVPPGVAVEVAERLRGPLGRARAKPVYVECNAISPATCRQIHGLLGAISFIDAGIIGGPPAAGTQDPARGPRFYASGPDAHLLTRLANFGLDIAILDGPVGAASGLKLSYAGLTKGFTALCATMLGAAEREGLDDALRAELARSQPIFLAWLDRAVPAMRPKAYRWVAEMRQIAEFVGSPDDGATIYEGAALLYQRTANQRHKGRLAGG